jgi:hypothetical protein
LKWEFRVLYLGVIGYVFLSAGQREAAFVIFAVCVFAVLVTDAIVSVVLMVMFIRPVMDTLKMAKGVVSTPAQRKLQKTAWMAMGEWSCFS